MTLKQYPEGSRFTGVVGRTADESSPAWPTVPRAPKDSPNVVFIVLDDTGFGQLRCFGSPIETPNLDALAQNGLRYNNMHTTALCSPSRSCIITAETTTPTPWRVSPSSAPAIPDTTATSPSRTATCPRSSSSVATAPTCVGKWHLIPADQETGAGPYNRWPLGRGFERFYGFLGRRHQSVASRPRLRQPPGRTATDARGGLPPHRGPRRHGDPLHRRCQAGRSRTSPSSCTSAPAPPTRPTMCPRSGPTNTPASSTTAGTRIESGPLPARRNLASRPQDAELSRHDPDVPEWDSLSPDARRLASRMMEVFAGFLSHTDHHIGRVFEFLRSIDEFDNTIVMFVSDNGASAEGGVDGTTNEASSSTTLGDLGGEPGRY